MTSCSPSTLLDRGREHILFRNTPFPLRGTRFYLRAQFLAAGEFRYGEGVEAVHGVFVGEHYFHDLVELGEEVFFS